MGRYYSKDGCDKCKQRKKKCDEEKPICDACRRLNLICSYGQKSTIASERTVNAGRIFSLPWLELGSREAMILSRMPASVIRFYSPTGDRSTYSTSSLMRTALSDDLVRHAVVACFSTILPEHNNKLGTLDRASLGSALRLINAAMDRSLDVNLLASLLLGIQFLGLIESVGPGKQGFEMMHWLALSTVMHEAEKVGVQKLPLETPMLNLLAEAIVYHFVVGALFSHDMDALQRRWEGYHLSTLLERMVPRNMWIAKSPLMGGQYDLWRLAYEVVSMNRRGQASPAIVQRLQAEVEWLQAGLTEDFIVAKGEGPIQRWMSSTYHAHCLALQIGLLALERPSEQRDRKIARLTTAGVMLVVALEFLPYALSPASWAFMMLALAIEREDEWKAFYAKMSQLKLQMDAGHVRRLNVVLSLAGPGRKSETLPGTLYLIQQREGILMGGVENGVLTPVSHQA